MAMVADRQLHARKTYGSTIEKWNLKLPVVLRLDGFKFMFYSNEGTPREPIHIHARRARDEAKFWLLPNVALAYNDGFNAKTLNQVQRLVEKHREQLEGAWNDYFA